MVSAREAALRDRRTTTKRKVLRPGSLSSAVDSIARKMADAQFESMVKRYGDGVVSNEEMFSYLQSAMSNPYFTDMDRVNIADKLRDFEVAVIGERLEAEFQSNEGEAKIRSAQELAAYYSDRATNLEQNTPAQSKALQAVAEWKDKAQKVYDNIKKEERKFSRAQKEYQISQLPPGVDNLEQQAEAYKQLATEAQQDGESIDALEWASKANDIWNDKLPKAREKEARDDIDDRLDIVKSEYERGYITADDAVIELNAIDQFAQENGLYDVLATIDAFTEKLGLDVQKGTTIEEFEGRTFRIRTAGGGELEVNIKDMKAMFQEEDDELRRVMHELDQDPQVLSRYGAKVSVLNAYINGGILKDGTEFYGLNNRKAAYDSWVQQAPEKQYTYENSSRDTQYKITTSLDDLSEFVYALDAIAGDDPFVQQLVANVVAAFEEGQITTFDGGQQMGIMVSYDSQGRQTEKTIPLNTQFQEYDAAGNSIITDTTLGSAIALIPGSNNVYVKLNPIYMFEKDVPGQFNQYAYAEYNGEFYIMDTTAFNGELVKAKDLAETNDDINLWYNSIDERTGVSQKDFEAQRYELYFAALAPDKQEEIKLQQQQALADSTQDLQLEERKPSEGPLQDFGLETLRGEDLAPRGVGDFNFDQSYFTPMSDPSSFTYSPGTYTPPAQDFSSQLIAPKYTAPTLNTRNIDFSSLNKTKYAPPTKQYSLSNLDEVYSALPKISGSFQKPKSIFTKAKETIKSTVSSVGNWLKSINPFN